MGQQTISNDRTYVSPKVLSTKSHEFQEYSSLFYKPHTLTSLAFLLVLLYWMTESDTLNKLAILLSFNEDKSSDEILKLSEVYHRNGAIIGVCIAFVAFGSIHFPNTIMTRPHPLFWRALLSIFCLYAMFITYLLLLPVDQARQTLRMFDDTLGVNLPERSYGEDCRVFTPENPNSQMANISDAVFDVHFIAHLAGWWGKMLIMRDWYIAWTCSIGFEILEITFRHWLPNFWECWWDHLFLDLFGCNLLGIILGAYTL